MQAAGLARRARIVATSGVFQPSTPTALQMEKQGRIASSEANPSFSLSMGRRTESGQARHGELRLMRELTCIWVQTKRLRLLSASA